VGLLPWEQRSPLLPDYHAIPVILELENSVRALEKDVRSARASPGIHADLDRADQDLAHLLVRMADWSTEDPRSDGSLAALALRHYDEGRKQQVMDPKLDTMVESLRGRSAGPGIPASPKAR
jgi:hypothetical protein